MPSKVLFSPVHMRSIRLHPSAIRKGVDLMKFSEACFAEHMNAITGSAIRDIFKLLGKPGMISFG